ncbi:MAG: hypothetical protein NTY38_27015 [Acidobacteria bacterium]|nr:hypothetical protein [Acidobacteriota bacterium]
MAQPIPLELPRRDPREELRARVDKAPAEHAEAILAAYEVLQGLHDRGILDLIRGALGASDQILETVVAKASTPQSIHAMRNLVFWRRILGSIEPEWFQAIFKAIPEGLALATRSEQKPPGIWTLLVRLRSRDTLRGMAAAIDILSTFGRHLARPERPGVRG